MQKIWNWFKDNANAIGTFVGILVVLGGGAKYVIIDPIHQRFDAIDQRFGDLRAEMSARFDAQDKRIDDLKAEMNTRFDAQDKHINQRFDAQDKHINQRFDAQDKHINQRFDAQDKYINQRFDAQDKYINQHFDALDQRLERVEKLDERVSQNEIRIDIIQEQLQTADAPSP